MDLSLDRNSSAVTQRTGPVSSNFTAQNQSTAIANTSIPHEVPGIRHFALSGDVTQEAPTPLESPEDQLSSFSYISVEVHYTLLLFIMVCSVAINGLVFVLFYQRPSVRMPSNKFVLNMAIVHLLQTFIVLPFVFVSVLFQEWIFGEIFCKIHGTLSVCLTMANVFSILLIAVDRNCAVNSPLHYSMTITKKRTNVLILSTWVFAIVVSVPPLVGVSGLQYQKSWAMCTVTWYDTGLLTLAYSCVLCVLGFLLPFVRITWIYTSMFQAARRNSACTRLHNIKSGSNEISPPPSAGLDGGSDMPVCLNRKSAWSKRTTSSQVSSLFGDKLKAVRTGVFVVVSFTACFLPFFAMTVVEPHAQTLKAPLHNLPAIAMLLLFSSSLVNPYLYVIRNKATRKHIRKMFHCLTRKPSFFSPQGYHHSHQSPLQEPRCSDGTRVLESTASLRSDGSEEYQRTWMRQSLCRNKSGEWNIIAVTTEPSTSPSRRSSILVHRPRYVDEMEELFQQDSSYHHNKSMPARYGASVMSSSYRRASLDSGKVPCERFTKIPEKRFKRTSTTVGTSGDRSKSFRIRGRYANRKELSLECDPSCNMNVNHEDWRRYLSESCQRRHGSNARHDLRSYASILTHAAEVHRAAPRSATCMAPAGHTCLPVLVRGRSLAMDEREKSAVVPAQAISRSGGLRKTQFAMGRRSSKQSSSDTNTTTLESLTSTESQELPIISSPRTLSPTSLTSYRYPHVQTHQQHQQQCWRQRGYSSVPPPTAILCQQLHQSAEVPQDSQDRRDSGFEDTMLERCDLCCTAVSEHDSIKAMKFIEHV
ncbi:G-protein coupled receptor 161-like [Rhipicephalus sanguineus]|uniref:G-protein coupled receptor 161-like n=1 Tax=Rhipicephalus sanguineus TaxID=34632 RepID=UPI0020C447B2|nr:G-protein coupled receptor 161-like [Rhipicephalus sanguineus]